MQESLQTYSQGLLECGVAVVGGEAVGQTGCELSRRGHELPSQHKLCPQHVVEGNAERGAVWEGREGNM